jgi:ketosteroid isomerase-like protein
MNAVSSAAAGSARSLESRLQELLDKEEIRELVQRYARALDRCDLELMKSVFHDDGVFEHADHYKGPAHGFCEHAVGFLSTLGPLQHFVCQQLIEVHGETAYGESYGLAFHRAHDPSGKAFDAIVGARLLDRYTRRNGAWKIAHRKTVVEWSADPWTEEHWGRGAFGPQHMGEEFKGKKGAADPSYAWFAGRAG